MIVALVRKTLLHRTQGSKSYFIKENSMYSYRIFLINRYEYHFKNANDFKYGQALYNALFYSKKLYLTWPKTIENFTLIMQIRNEFRTRNHNYYLDNSEIKASGSNLFFLVPQINYSIGETWNISFLVDIPVYSYYNETQLAQKYSFSFSLNKDIIFKWLLHYKTISSINIIHWRLIHFQSLF